ncbi:MAG TPA: TIGR03936 family radical SAM-associated protein [Nocardioidaceae bacterium]|nr:TIGR03936 family radical SAM-associated protein [Nocardioidaceae bacterium]
MREQPEQQAPPVQRMRIRYAKRGRLRFTSHRDFSRAFERAIVRARVPMAYSSGFNPHPRISYAGAAPTGSASEAEYLEIALAEEVDPRRVEQVLDEALPAGLDVLEVVVSAGGTLADRLEVSRWRLTLPGATTAAAEEAVRAFLATEEVLVERMTKKGLRQFNCRAAVVSLASQPTPETGEECAILDVVLRHGTPSVRPDDVLAGLREVAGLEVGTAPLHERLAQGPLDTRTGTVGDPLAPDRDAV